MRRGIRVGAGLGAGRDKRILAQRRVIASDRRERGLCELVGILATPIAAGGELGAVGGVSVDLARM